jgi:hypothetical protein
LGFAKTGRSFQTKIIKNICDDFYCSICREPACGKLIPEYDVTVTETGAGLKIKARCQKHVHEWSSAEFFNQGTLMGMDAEI